MKKNILFKTLVLIVVCVIFSAVVSAAEPLSLEFAGPNGPAGGDFIGYVKRLYEFAVGIAGVFAVGMIVAGAIIYSTSGGGDRKREGINYITSALWGVALLLGSYLILKTVNPRLVQLREPNIERLGPCTPATPSTTLCIGTPYSGYSSGASSTTECPTTGQLSCFFNPSRPTSTAACNFQNEDESCLAINKSTQACRIPSISNFPRPGNANCVCPNCSPLLGFPVSVGACANNLIPTGVCLLEESVKAKARSFMSVVTSFPGWKVIEAFPPVSVHGSLCHYTGRCFDISTSLPNPPSSPFCSDIKNIANLATQDFNLVAIEGLPTNNCSTGGSAIPQGISGGVFRKPYVTSTVFHIHIQ